jgi:hypothetical protein
MNPHPIAREAKFTGWARVDRGTLNDLFPHPTKLSLAEVNQMICDALEHDIKPPPEAPTQAEQIREFCETEGLIFRDLPEERDHVTFFCKGVPTSMKGVKKHFDECAMGECVHASDVPEHVRHSDLVEAMHRRVPDPCWYGTVDYTAKVLATPLLFRRVQMMNGESVFVRIR